MSLHTGKGTDWAIIGKWIGISGAATAAVALLNVAATINRNRYILFRSSGSQQAGADSGALGGPRKERVLCGYKFSVNVEAIAQSFWYRVDCALQRRQLPGSSDDKSAPAAGGDFLYGDIHHPKWPRSGKVQPKPSSVISRPSVPPCCYPPTYYSVAARQPMVCRSTFLHAHHCSATHYCTRIETHRTYSPPPFPCCLRHQTRGIEASSLQAGLGALRFCPRVRLPSSPACIESISIAGGWLPHIIPQARRLRALLILTSVLEMGDIITDCLWVNQLLTMDQVRKSPFAQHPPSVRLLAPFHPSLSAEHACVRKSGGRPKV